VVLGGTLFLLYLVIEMLVTEQDDGMPWRTRATMVFVQMLSVFALFFTVPLNFTAILLGIWCGNLLHFMRLSYAVALTPVFIFAFYAIFQWYWHQEGSHYSALLYWMLCLFTLVMINSWVRESESRKASQQMNRELLAAQSLLKEATKQSERVRIARDIHDLVGHHLTALTINLQVAVHHSEGEAKQQVEKSYAIAKLLLSDVREAVTEIREKSTIQIQDALDAVVSAIPRLKVAMELQDDLNITNVELADTIIKCVQESITNSLKHSNSDEFVIRLYREQQELKLIMQDNGNGQQTVTPGNGLLGMRERIQALRGKIAFENTPAGFVTSVSLPECV